MPTYVALLRGINIGSRNRVAMADLRALLTGLGYGDVRTHLQSGNAVFTAPDRSGPSVAAAVAKAVSHDLGMTIPVVVRSDRQLADVVAHDPFGDKATDHARYLVSFCEKKVPASALTDLDPAAFAPEEYAVVGRELYLWLPAGVQDSVLFKALTVQRLGATTARNWRTVLALHRLANG